MNIRLSGTYYCMYVWIHDMYSISSVWEDTVWGLFLERSISKFKYTPTKSKQEADHQRMVGYTEGVVCFLGKKHEKALQKRYMQPRKQLTAGFIYVYQHNAHCGMIWTSVYLCIHNWACVNECIFFKRLTSLLGSKAPEMLVAGRTLEGKVIIKRRDHPHYTR